MAKKILIAILSLFLLSAGHEGCRFQGQGEVNILSNVLPQFDVFIKELEKCEGKGFKFTWKTSTEHKTEQVQAFSAKTSPYDGAFVANNSITIVQSRGLLRPLDDLVAKYKDQYNIEDNMLIRIDGKVYAVAFMVNAQHFMYRRDLFEKYNLKVPETYDEVLKAARTLKREKSIDYPFGAAYKSGWNLSQEFQNIFLSFGGKFFKDGGFQPDFDSRAAVKTLRLMKELFAYMSPNSLVIDSGVVQQQMRDGKLGMAFLWGSRAQGIDDPAQSKVIGKVVFSSAPRAMEGGPAASTFFWDGFVIPKNADGDADLTFRAMMHVYHEEVVKENNDLTVWLRSTYQPTVYAEGVIATVKNKAPSYPMTPAYTHAHNAVGKFIGSYLAGEKSAREVLKEAKEEYIKVAKENGVL